MRRHEFDLTSLVVGLVFLCVAAIYLAAQATGTDVDASWLGPMILISLGLAGFLGGISRSVRARRPATDSTDSTDTADTDADTDTD